MSNRASKRAHNSSPALSDTGEGPAAKKARELSPELDDGGGDPSSGVDEDDPYDGVQAVAARALLAEDNDAPQTPERILESLSKKWYSKAYAHFRPPVIHRATPGGPVMHRFVCKKHPLKHVDRADYEDSTGNLSRHVQGCEPDKTAQTEMISAYGQGSQYSYPRVRFCIAMWCARRHRPFSIIEDPELLHLLKMLYGRVELPKRLTVSRDVQFIHATAKIRLIIILKGLPCRIHICVDGWTSPNILSFLGITAHWHHDGKIRHVILDFVRLTALHTGKNLAESLINALREFGIEEKVFSVTCDNAENNTTMLKEMHVLVPKFCGDRVHVQCFGHVLNLVVKAILSQFTKPKPCCIANATQTDSDNEEDEDEDEQDEEDAVAADEADSAREAADQHIIDALGDDIVDIALTEEDLRLGRNALNKILTLSRRVWNSPSIRAELTRLAQATDGVNSEVLIRAVKTCWNTVTEVLERALEMREALGDLCDMAQFNKKTGARLRRYLLTDEEWDILAQLSRLLDPFLFATKKISVSDRALVQDVIPYMDILTNLVDKFRQDEQLAPSVRAAAQRGRVILDKYYTLTDETMIYCLAMILHPGHKLQYFRDENWPEEWINEAVELLHAEWRQYYKPAPPEQPEEAPADAPALSSKGKGKATASAQPSTGRKSAQASTEKATTELFASISNAGKSAKDALEVYLEEPKLTTVDDPLHHWNLMLTSGNPWLARMALDFLSIPATSTDAERAFSRGHLTVSRLRHSMNEESVWTSTVLGSWANIPDLIPEEDFVDFLKTSSRRPRAVGAAADSEGAGAGPSGTSDVASSQNGSAVASSSKVSASSSQATVIEID
ncbi:hypothetical protein VTO73DRAFT_8663 [Trametes versicolor]